jgi:hypothetical protein
MLTLVGIKLAAISADDTRRIPVTPIQQPLATDVIVTLQGSAAVINRMLKNAQMQGKMQAMGSPLLTPLGYSERVLSLTEETK